MAETFSKKEKREKKAKKKQDKAQKMEERKVNNNKGKGLEEMMAYLDEYGNLTSVPPPAGRRRAEVNVQDILLGAAPVEAEETRRKGVVAFFSEKGYGFIIDGKSGEKIFVHKNELSQPVREGDKVTFEMERTARGLSAVRVEKES
ncbi:MAG: cold-shock protein [Cytophagaceae bacterium SCN 52-12]|nr:MAG: cold-shock protein [Cytophagaceae bacterium SCN 52-12]